MGEKVGAVVAMDPRNGEVLALVSSPSYNPNLFARGLEPADWEALIEDPNQPLQNRAIQNAYSPGSAFKIVMATAGLTEGTIEDHERRLLPRLGLDLRPHLRLRAGAAATAGWICPPRSNAPATSTSTTSARSWASSASRLLPRLRPGPRDRHRSPGPEAGPGPRPRLEPPGAAVPLVSGRDHLGGDRPGPDAHDSDRHGADDGDGGQRRAQGAPPSGATDDDTAVQAGPEDMPAAALAIVREGLSAVVNQPGGTAYGFARVPTSPSPARPAPSR